ncbi:unnamed protein product [Larinioides sclopetarius]|uniref:EGF-like domain-containing protein n=1 Tax=Larinioides sclopetarius TaxID=280406 RepID=A0AAV2BEY3_9ARAC
MTLMCMLFLILAAEVSAGPEPILVFATKKAIRAMFLRTGQSFPIHDSIAKAISVDVDPLESRVYWTEMDDKSSVYSSKLDGSDYSIVLKNCLDVPDGIAVDYVGRILYLTDAELKQIIACKMDGSMCHVLHSETVDKPRAIAVDPPEGLLYWSDWGDSTAGIYRSGMDGSRRIAMVSKDIKWPNGIAIDHASNRLYWCDAKLKTIEYITLDGETRTVLLTGVKHPFSLAVFEDNLYWSDWKNYTLESSNKFTGQNTTIIVRENGKIQGVRVYHPVLVRQANNPCRSNSCSHICLLAPLNTYRCACPPGFTLGRNGRICVLDGNYPMLLVSDESKIYHIRPEKTPSIAVSELPLNRIELIGGLAYDWKSKILFVSDLKTPAIYSFNMTTLSMRELVRHQLVYPESLAFDPRSGNLYWVDSYKGTVEVVAKAESKRFVIVANLSNPVDVALVLEFGKMFVSTIGESPSVWMYDMDGKNGKVLRTIVGFPVALAVYPPAGLLYLADSRTGTISSIDYNNPYSQPKIVREKVGNVTSIAANDTVLYWTDSKHHVLHLVTHKESAYQNISLPGTEVGMISRKVIYASAPKSSSFGSDCVNSNGECDFLCLTSAVGYTCVCPLGIQSSEDGRSCSEATEKCSNNHFNCSNGRCILSSSKCDGTDDCGDYSDEIGCSPQNCPDNDFNCSNGRCILSSSKCDGTDDCGDNSDEIGCSPQNCPDNDFNCSNGRCILSSSKCDGTDDCGDNSDEIGCPCEDYPCPVSGECISWSSVCDEKQNCADLMDEGPLCASSCEGGNGSCAHKCQKTPQGPKCSCHEGYVLSKDGVSCYNECDSPGKCSHICNRTKDGFKCSCAEGYVLETDQRTCKAVGGEAYLAYLVKDGIRGLGLETYSRQVYSSKNFVSVIGLGYDAAEGTIFWSDPKEKTINSYSAGSSRFEVLSVTQQEPLLLRRDWMTKNIYYTTDQGSIVCCNGNGNYCTLVITNVSSHISGFDISPAFGFIFWSVSRHHELKSVSGVIERAKLDGSFREVIVSEGIFLLTAIAVDPVSKAIYWCDSVLGVIESTDFNGFRRRKVVDHLQYPISLTVFEDYIYWAERATNSLSRCDKFSGEDRKTLLRETTPLNSLLIIHKAAQIQGENRCAGNNCLHICLPTGTSFVCRCEDRKLTNTSSCELHSSSVNHSCPENYCPENILCVVDGGRFVCKCPSHLIGERCEKSLQLNGNSSNEPHPLWIVCSVLVVICLCLLATSVLVYRKYRKSAEMTSGSKVQYVNTTSFQETCEEAGKNERRENEYDAVIIL